MLKGLFLFLFNLPSIFGALGGLVGRTQSVGVEGILTCNGRPLGDVLVKLYDDDRGLDMDEFMAKTKTDRNGHFRISGSISEITSIDPKLNIYHDCNDGWIVIPCQRKISIMIPDNYITDGKTPKRFYDAGKIELSGKFKGETRDCIH
uniref:Transthyretin/hydroxyisourate hydrolase domain-containing protein n=1 Tax=Setaria digitata TaxID=48799 RepID=A0A915PDT7_9BILA